MFSLSGFSGGPWMTHPNSSQNSQIFEEIQSCQSFNIKSEEIDYSGVCLVFRKDLIIKIHKCPEG